MSTKYTTDMDGWTTWTDYTGDLDLNAIYDLGNQWIAMGDALYRENLNYIGQIGALGWQGKAFETAQDAWTEHVSVVLNHAANQAWKVGEVINAYGDELKKEAEKMAEANNKAYLIGIFSFFLSVVTAPVAMGLGGLLSSLLQRLIASLVDVTSQLSKLAVGLGVAADFADGVISGAFWSATIDLGANGLASAVTHTPVTVDGKETGLNIVLGAAMGGGLVAALTGVRAVNGELGGFRLPPNSRVPTGMPPDVPGSVKLSDSTTPGSPKPDGSKIPGPISPRNVTLEPGGAGHAPQNLAKPGLSGNEPPIDPEKALTSSGVSTPPGGQAPRLGGDRTGDPVPGGTSSPAGPLPTQRLTGGSSVAEGNGPLPQPAKPLAQPAKPLASGDVRPYGGEPDHQKTPPASGQSGPSGSRAGGADTTSPETHVANAPSGGPDQPSSTLNGGHGDPALDGRGSGPQEAPTASVPTSTSPGGQAPKSGGEQGTTGSHNSGDDSAILNGSGPVVPGVEVPRTSTPGGGGASPDALTPSKMPSGGQDQLSSSPGGEQGKSTVGGGEPSGPPAGPAKSPTSGDVRPSASQAGHQDGVTSASPEQTPKESTSQEGDQTSSGAAVSSPSVKTSDGGVAKQVGAAAELKALNGGLSPSEAAKWKADFAEGAESGGRAAVMELDGKLRQRIDEAVTDRVFNDANKVSYKNSSGSRPVDPSSGDSGGVTGEQGYSSGSSSHGDSSSGAAAGGGVSGKSVAGAASESAPAHGGKPTVVVDRPTAEAPGNGETQWIIDGALKGDLPVEGGVRSVSGAAEQGHGEVGLGSSGSSRGGGEAGSATPQVKGSDGVGTSSGPVSKAATESAGGSGLADHFGGEADHSAVSGVMGGPKAESFGAAVERRALALGLSRPEAAKWRADFARAHDSGVRGAVAKLEGKLIERFDEFIYRGLYRGALVVDRPTAASRGGVAKQVGAAAELKALNGGLSPSEAAKWKAVFAEGAESGGRAAVMRELDGKLRQRIDEVAADRVAKKMSDIDTSMVKHAELIRSVAKNGGFSSEEAEGWRNKFYEAYRAGGWKSAEKVRDDFARYLEDVRQGSAILARWRNSSGSRPVDPSSGDSGGVTGEQGYSSGSSSHGDSSSGAAAGGGVSGKSVAGAASESAPAHGGKPTVVVDRPTAEAPGNGETQWIIDGALKGDLPVEGGVRSVSGAAEQGHGEVGLGSSGSSRGGGEAGSATPQVKGSDGVGTSSGPVSKAATESAGGSGLADHFGGEADHSAVSGVMGGPKAESFGAAVERRALALGLSRPEAAKWRADFARAHDSGVRGAVAKLEGKLIERFDEFIYRGLYRGALVVDGPTAASRGGVAKQVGAAAELKALDGGLSPSEAAKWKADFAEGAESGGRAAVMELDGKLRQRIDEAVTDRVFNDANKVSYKNSSGSRPVDPSSGDSGGVTGEQGYSSGSSSHDDSSSGAAAGGGEAASATPPVKGSDVGEGLTSSATVRNDRPTQPESGTGASHGEQAETASSAARTPESGRPASPDVAVRPSTVTPPVKKAADESKTSERPASAKTQAASGPATGMNPGAPRPRPTNTVSEPSAQGLEAGTAVDRARATLDGLSDKRRAQVMSEASGIVYNLSWLVPSVTDPGGAVSRLDRVGLLVAAEVARAGREAGTDLVWTLLPDLKHEPLVPRVPISGERLGVARTRLEQLWNDSEDQYAQILNEARLIVRELTGVTPSPTDVRGQAGRLTTVWLLTAAEIPLAGHRAAHGLAADLIGLPRLPRFGVASRFLDDLANAAQHDPARASTTLGLLSPPQREGLLSLTDVIIREAITRPRTGQGRARAPREWRLLVAAEIARFGDQAGENLAQNLLTDNPPRPADPAKTQPRDVTTDSNTGEGPAAVNPGLATSDVGALADSAVAHREGLPAGAGAGKAPVSESVTGPVSEPPAEAVQAAMWSADNHGDGPPTGSGGGVAFQDLPEIPVVQGTYDHGSFSVRVRGRDLDPEQTAQWITGNTAYEPGGRVILDIPGVGMPGPDGGPSFAELVATHLGGPVVAPRSGGQSPGSGWMTYRPDVLPPATVETPVTAAFPTAAEAPMPPGPGTSASAVSPTPETRTSTPSDHPTAENDGGASPAGSGAHTNVVDPSGAELPVVEADAEGVPGTDGVSSMEIPASVVRAVLGIAGVGAASGGVTDAEPLFEVASEPAADGVTATPVRPVTAGSSMPGVGEEFQVFAADVGDAMVSGLWADISAAREGIHIDRWARGLPVGEAALEEAYANDPHLQNLYQALASHLGEPGAGTAWSVEGGPERQGVGWDTGDGPAGGESARQALVRGYATKSPYAAQQDLRTYEQSPAEWLHNSPAEDVGAAQAAYAWLREQHVDDGWGRVEGVLGGYGVRRVPMPPGSNDFFRAFLRSAGDVPGAGVTVEQLQGVVANTLTDLRVQGAGLPVEVLDAVQRSWFDACVAEGVDPESLPVDAGWPAVWWPQVAERVRAGLWAGEGGPLVPYLTARLLNARIRVVSVGGVVEFGDGGFIVTLFWSPGGGWEATEPLSAREGQGGVVRSWPPSAPPAGEITEADLRQAAVAALEHGVGDREVFFSGLRSAGWSLGDERRGRKAWRQEKDARRQAKTEQPVVAGWHVPPRPAGKITEADLRQAAVGALEHDLRDWQVFVSGLRSAGWSLDDTRARSAWMQEREARRQAKREQPVVAGWPPSAPPAGEITEADLRQAAVAALEHDVGTREAFISGLLHAGWSITYTLGRKVWKQEKDARRQAKREQPVVAGWRVPPRPEGKITEADLRQAAAVALADDMINPQFFAADLRQAGWTFATDRVRRAWAEEGGPAAGGTEDPGPSSVDLNRLAATEREAGTEASQFIADLGAQGVGDAVADPGVHSAPRAPSDLRPASSVPVGEVYAFDPAQVMSWTHRVLRVAERSAGFYRWTPSGPDPYDGFRIGRTGRPDEPQEFALWIRGEGPAPGWRSLMNCWEALLFTAYWSGAVDKRWLTGIHEAAANAARAQYWARADTQVGVEAEDKQRQRASEAYYDALATLIVGGDVTEHQHDPGTGMTTPDIPAGHLVIFNRIGDHVALALGTRDALGRQEVMSHWEFPRMWASVHGQQFGPGFLQKTTVEELAAAATFGPALVIRSVPPMWPVVRFDPGAGGIPAPVPEPGDKIRKPASGDWADRLGAASVVRVETQRFDPRVDFLRAARSPHAAGWETLVRMNVQRVRAVNGTWVRNHVIVLPVRPMHGVFDGDIAALQRSWNRGFDQYVNQEYELPESKDQLFMAVKLVIDRGHGEAMRVWPGRTAAVPERAVQRTNARNIGLRDPVVVALHELLHWAGLPDEYVDSDALFRRAETSSAVHTDGVMAGGAFDPSAPMPKRYLRIIESVVDATANLDVPDRRDVLARRGAVTGAAGQRGVTAEEVAALPVYEVLGRRDDVPSHPAPLGPASDAASVISDDAEAFVPEDVPGLRAGASGDVASVDTDVPATRPPVDVPDIVIVPVDEEDGTDGEESGTPTVEISGTTSGRTEPSPLDELAELYPSVAMPTPPRPPLRFFEVVAEEDVWKYIIEARHHDVALEEHQSDPGHYYDNHRSPGYWAAMFRTFNEVFDREDPIHLDWNTYNHLHDLVTRDVNGEFQRNGVGGSMGRFPLSAYQPAPDVLNEVIGGRRLISSYDQARRRIDADENVDSLTVYQRNVIGKIYTYTFYGSDETPALVDEVFNNFRTEISSATTDLDRLIAISRTIRALHVLHPYADGNGRLNLNVLLPYLLLRYGFHPVISDNLHAIFNGGYSLHQIVAVLLRGQPQAGAHLRPNPSDSEWGRISTYSDGRSCVEVVVWC